MGEVGHSEHCVRVTEPAGAFMSRRDLIDPESIGPLDQLLQVLPDPNVPTEDRTVPGPDGAPDITVRIYRPASATGTVPGIYYIHGGGMIFGDIQGEDPSATKICDEVGAVVVSVEYRLAPEDPHPAQVEDCYAGLVWMARSAGELGIDPERLA